MKPDNMIAATGRTARPGMYLDRELSMLSFNRRVLAQAEDKNIPLLERLRYLCIVSNNLDEFFEVRVASLLAQGSIDGDLSEHPALVASLERISAECHDLVEHQYAILNNDVLPQLSAKGVHLLRHSDRNEAQRAWVKNYFDSQVRPLLTPIGLDPAHPFPQVVNKSLNFIISLSGKDAFGRGTAIAIVKAPRVLPRVIRLPEEVSNNGVAFCLLSSIIHAHISDLFTGREVIAYSQFRLTRDSDLWVDEEEVKNLRQALQGELQSRQFGAAVRLEVAKNCPEDLAQFLLNQFSLDRSRLYPVNGPVNMVRLSELIDHVKIPSLRFPPFSPGSPPKLVNNDIFATIEKLIENGVRFVPISHNYYDDLLARFDLPTSVVARMRRLSILYERFGGEYFHAYSEPFAGRFFFEIVQRTGGYDGYGALNAPARIASQVQRGAAAAHP